MRRRRIAALFVAVALGVVALDCAAAPKSQCTTGSRKTTPSHHVYTCHNGEWVKDK